MYERALANLARSRSSARPGNWRFLVRTNQPRSYSRSLMAMRAIQGCLAGFLTLVVEVALFHHVLRLPVALWRHPAHETLEHSQGGGGAFSLTRGGVQSPGWH